ncbi:hypothetical protein GCM10023257_28510 [Streptomyces hyderabadensis]|uniref:Uncharacterized protein n=1 Tax=Streptomyces hyderabadensis TaxID=598549 RepID=A0ABP9I3G5_9ACTN
MPVTSALLISKPYEERRAYATACKMWPGVEWVCASTPMALSGYIDSIGDARLVVDMLVGAHQRLMIYPRQGFMTEQEIPDDIRTAHERLRDHGFTRRLAPETAERS